MSWLWSQCRSSLRSQCTFTETFEAVVGIEVGAATRVGLWMTLWSGSITIEAVATSTAADAGSGMI